MERRTFLYLAAGGTGLALGGGALLFFREATVTVLKQFTRRQAASLAALSRAIVDHDVSPVLDATLDDEAVAFYRDGLDAMGPASAQSAFESRNELLRQFMEQAFDDITRIYYTSNEGFAAVKFPGPPQPRGYSNYEAAP